MKQIVVVGSINMDLVSRAPRIPRPGETITGTVFQMHPGGKGANQAVAAARLGQPCTLLGKVGNDVFGEALLQGLTENGVDISRIERSDLASGTASITVDDSGENCIIVTPGANHEVTIAYLERHKDLLRNAGMVLAQLEIPLDTVEWLAHACREWDVPLMLDPAPACELPASLLRDVTWFTPNESEAAFFVEGEVEPEAILRSLAEKGVERIVLKRGSKGVVLSEAPGNAQTIDAHRVTAQDTTAAGDAFNGAFAVGLMRGQTPADSARLAAAAASLSVTRQGAQPSMATQEELEAFLQGRSMTMSAF